MALELAASVCEVCGGRGHVRERKDDRATARLCACSRECSVCGNSGFARVVREDTFSEKVGKRSYEVLSPCECRGRTARLERFAEAGIPGVLAHADFDGYRASSEAQHQACQVARAFADAFRAGKPARGFIISGPVGTGKTHLLSAVLAQLTLESGVRARYQEISLLYADIRRGFRDGKSGGEIIGPLSEVDVLAIDELGKGRGSQFEMETLDELIARRYNAAKLTLFATNFSLEREQKAQRSPSGYLSTEDARGAARESTLLRERVGERIYSRLCDMCTFVEMPQDSEVSKDYRVMRQELEQRQSRPRQSRR
ncbi:MAG: ATP-binding protein [Myxococcaceae bacterium]|nr:ATP-binding protein [Myxococcaceae bacterium]MCI0671520.1 ATP-binding protein [Myxococcaceae bacterium]